MRKSFCKGVKKYGKIMTLVFLGIIFLILQIRFSPESYNYAIFWLLAFLAIYFEEIQSVSVGVFKINLKEYEKIADHIDTSILSMYQLFLQQVFETRNGGCFGSEEALHEKIPRILSIFDDIKKLPKKLQSELEKDVKDSALKVALLQKKQLEQGVEAGYARAGLYKTEDLVEFYAITLAEKYNNTEAQTKLDFKNAKEAYDCTFDI